MGISRLLLTAFRDAGFVETVDSYIDRLALYETADVGGIGKYLAAVVELVRLIARKARDAGVYVEAKEWQDTFHTFEMMPTILPEAREEVNDSIAFLKDLGKKGNHQKV